jgi:O-antigen ligase
LVADGFIQYFFNKNIIGLIPISDANGPRISSFFGSELVMGSYLSRLFPLYFGLFIHFIKKMGNMYVNLHLIFFCLIYIIIFLTGERTAFFIINCTLLFLILLFQDFRKKISLVFLILALFFLTTLHYKPEIGNRVIKYTLSQLQSKHDRELVLFSAMHTGHYKTGIKMFFDNRMLGIGPNNFRKRCDEKKYKTLAYADSGDDMTTACSTHPHNIYIQLLAETCIIGFSLIFGLFCSLIYFSLKIFFKNKKIKIDNLTISLLGGFIINLFPLMPAGNFFNNYINIIYFMPLGFYLWAFKNKI